MSKVYAVAGKSVFDFTKGERYEILREIENDLFYVIDDAGSEIACLWENCGFMGSAGWERVEVEDSPKVKLRPGDYVSTKGMTEEQYHAVAKAFIEAGAVDFHNHANRGIHTLTGKYLEWFAGDICMTDDVERNGRHLSIDQVLGEGVEQEDETATIQSLLKKADKHARKAQKHEDKRKEAIDQARAMLPDGWELTPSIDHDFRIGYTPLSEVAYFEFSAGVFGADGEDLTDPANWREGDVLKVVDADHNDGVKNGDLVVHNDTPGSAAPYCKKPDGGIRAFAARRQLRFHHRP